MRETRRDESTTQTVAVATLVVAKQGQPASGRINFGLNRWQCTDIVAYVIIWGLRLNGMTASAREERLPLTTRVKRLRFSRETEAGEKIWGFKHIKDVRPTGIKPA